MSILQSGSRSNGGENLSSEAKPVAENSGWEVESSGWDSDITDGYYQEEPSSKPLVNEKALIRAANRKVALSSLFGTFNISFEEFYSPSGWTHKCACPLPGHKDKTPSFGFNPKENRFYCFGCQTGGGPVQLYAALRRQSFSESARVLLSNNSILGEVVEDINNSEDEEIDKILLYFSDSVNSLLKSDPNSLEFVENLSWCLDLYLQKHIPRQSLDLDNITARVNLLIKKIEEYNE